MWQPPWETAPKSHIEVIIMTFNWNRYLCGEETWWFSQSGVQTTNLHHTAILESQLLLHWPAGLTVINCFKGMREQMALMQWTKYPRQPSPKILSNAPGFTVSFPSLLYWVRPPDCPDNIFKLWGQHVWAVTHQCTLYPTALKYAKAKTHSNFFFSTKEIWFVFLMTNLGPRC